jgi:hypothetical protein
MLQVLWAVFVALVLVSCGGGGGGMDSTLSASPTSAALQAKRASPGSTLVAEPVSMVNTLPTKGSLRDIGATTDGGYVVAWFSGSSTIYIQAYDSTGAKVGAQTPLQLEIVAPSLDDSRRAIETASVAVLTDGTVVVVYRVSREVLSSGFVDTITGVYFQRFDANGALLMGEAEVVSQLEPPQNPRRAFISGYVVRALSDGGFVVGWTNTGPYVTGRPSNVSLYLRWFDSQGQPEGSAVGVAGFPELRLTSIEADSHGGVTLSASYVDNQLRFIESAVWHYDADRVLQPTVAPGLSPMLLLHLESGYVLFTSGTCDQPCPITGPSAQILDSQGNPIGTSTPIAFMPIAARELADGSYVTIAPTTAGTFVAQRFAADGTPLGDPVAIDSGGLRPGVAALADTGFAAAWTGAGATGETDVFTQRFVVEKFNERKKACLDSAKGLKGKERKAFVDACMG